MKKNLLAMGLFLGAGAFVAGTTVSAMAEDKKHEETCSACHGKVEHLVCEKCGETVHEKDGKEHCDHCKADVKGECKACYEKEHKKH